MCKWRGHCLLWKMTLYKLLKINIFFESIDEMELKFESMDIHSLLVVVGHTLYEK